jgi:ABC-2 type transport system permease protein
MFRSTFTRTLHGMRHGLLGWSIGVTLTVWVMAAIWPSMESMDIDALLAQYPEPLKEAFNVADYGTGTGYLNGELFSIVLPAIFCVYAIGRGARLVAGEERDGLLELVATTPTSRTSILLQKAAALVAGVAVLGLVLWVAIVVGSAVVDMDVDPTQAALASVLVTLLAVEFGAVALAVGAVTGSRAVAVAATGGLAVAAYLLYLVGQLVESVRPYRWLSPIYQAIVDGPIGPTAPGIAVIMPLVAVAVVAVAVPVFDRRDLAG